MITAPSVGNAAVSNYPGKIVSKLRRALRYPAAARRQGLRGEVQVAFTVSASGSVGGVRIVRSSGSSVLDKAALETVRRAAPFPAIPADAGRSSWPFTVPLAFTRGFPQKDRTVLLTGLHQLAAGRGDGLLPELRALLESRARASQHNVTELGARRGDDFVQAGPHPVTRVEGELPAGVIPFRHLPAPSKPAVTRKTSIQR